MFYPLDVKGRLFCFADLKPSYRTLACKTERLFYPTPCRPKLNSWGKCATYIETSLTEPKALKTGKKNYFIIAIHFRDFVELEYVKLLDSFENR